MNIAQEPLCYAVEAGAPGGIRTHDPRFRRPMLYPLSYGRVCIGGPYPWTRPPLSKAAIRRYVLKAAKTAGCGKEEPPRSHLQWLG